MRGSACSAEALRPDLLPGGIPAVSPGFRRRGVAIVLALSALLTACSSPGASPVVTPSASISVAPSPQASPSTAAAFPATLIDDEHTTVEIAAEPQADRVTHPGHHRDPVRDRRRRPRRRDRRRQRLSRSGRGTSRRGDVLERRRRAGGRTSIPISCSPAAWASPLPMRSRNSARSTSRSSWCTHRRCKGCMTTSR